MVDNLYCCDKCKSAEHTNEFRLNPANFSQLTVSFYASGSGPHMMPGQASDMDNRNETFHICSECKTEILSNINVLISPLKV